eukprot:scaffold24175_cov125-Isochrysis_galbana.AAC.5
MRGTSACRTRQRTGNRREKLRSSDAVSEGAQRHTERRLRRGPTFCVLCEPRQQGSKSNGPGAVAAGGTSRSTINCENRKRRGSALDKYNVASGSRWTTAGTSPQKARRRRIGMRLDQRANAAPARHCARGAFGGNCEADPLGHGGSHSIPARLEALYE